VHNGDWPGVGEGFHAWAAEQRDGERPLVPYAIAFNKVRERERVSAHSQHTRDAPSLALGGAGLGSCWYTGDPTRRVQRAERGGRMREGHTGEGNGGHRSAGEQQADAHLHLALLSRGEVSGLAASRALAGCPTRGVPPAVVLTDLYDANRCFWCIANTMRTC
jgi:hypothetical protein